ncbi:uncharacterized protein CBL_01988 [Carabus blaptoides fortunei]
MANVVEHITIFLSYVLFIVTFPLSLPFCLKVVPEYQRAIVFRMGRLRSNGPLGPGLIYILPNIDSVVIMDLRIITSEVVPQEVLSKDSVTVTVDAVILLKVIDPLNAVIKVHNFSYSTGLLAATFLRNILGTRNLHDILSDRQEISRTILNILDEATDPWGVKIERVEIKEVRLPYQMQRAMAAEAAASREARAKVITAQGELKASRALKEASDVITQSSTALQLRYLQTLNAISTEKESTIVFPLPIDIIPPEMVLLWFCFKSANEYQRVIIFRLGRMRDGTRGPGLFFVLPIIDLYYYVDLRVVTFDIPPQEILTEDSVTVVVDAVVYYRVSDPISAIVNIFNYGECTRLLGATTLRNVLGTKNLAEVLADRETISHAMQVTLDEATDPWGVQVDRVEIKDVSLPVSMQRAMAAEGEATREANAQVIAAEGELKASQALKEASDVMSGNPAALQLRYLQTLNTISVDRNRTIVFPLPLNLIRSFTSDSQKTMIYKTTTKKQENVAEGVPEAKHVCALMK